MKEAGSVNVNDLIPEEEDVVENKENTETAAEPQEQIIEISLADLLGGGGANMEELDAALAEQMSQIEDNFLAEVAAWVKSVSFAKFSKEIKKRVIGQDNLDIILADIYNYLENIAFKKKINNNALMAAPSGCGKTETFRAVRDYFKIRIPDLVVAQVDVSVITEEGITGGSISLLTEPLMESDLGGYGIIFMDEFDKKLIPSIAEGTNINAAVQNQLLTIIEGREVPETVEGQPTGYSIDTSKTMFIGLGSFNETRESKKKQSKNAFGFTGTSEKHDYFEDISREDMIKLGASYEMIGRFPFIVNYHILSYDAVEKIIDKTVKEISASFGVKIVLSKEMREQLHKDANGVYGCRLIDSSIRAITMKYYVIVLTSGIRKSNCTIKINSKDSAEIIQKTRTEKALGAGGSKGKSGRKQVRGQAQRKGGVCR